jgi:hypothetical protein
MSEQLTFDVDPPSPPSDNQPLGVLPQERLTRLSRAGLRPGSTRVWRDREGVYATGDIAHCGHDDIHHNVCVLASLLRANRKLRAIWKGYEGSMTNYTCPLSQVPRLFFTHYGNPVWEIDPNFGHILREVECECRVWEQVQSNEWECRTCHERLSTERFDLRYNDVVEAFERRGMGARNMDYTLTRTVA